MTTVNKKTWNVCTAMMRNSSLEATYITTTDSLDNTQSTPQKLRAKIFPKHSATKGSVVEKWLVAEI
jgi:hypothetical protein